MKNRSVPTDTILPHVTYRDIPAAIAWLSRAFGFAEHYRYGDPVSGAQMHLGNAWLMLDGPLPHRTIPAESGAGTQSLTIFVEDVETHCERARAAGAKILEEPHETVYGEWQYAAEDLDGHRWLFSRHLRDVSPSAWGAVVSNAAEAERTIELDPGSIGYLQIPATDTDASATFYAKMFDWKVDAESAGFEAPGLFGQWIEDRPPSANAGVLIWIEVLDIDATLMAARDCGGDILEPPTADGPRWIAMVRDPAGNALGVVQHDRHLAL
jgi:predicted enzyme related to lactoylglutathione lyase